MRALGDRIMLIGCGGSGKSVLTSKLAQKTGLPPFYLDREKQGFNTADEWLNVLHQLAEYDRWILDGNMGVMHMDHRMARATSILFLDFSRARCLYRGVMRNLRQLFSRRVREDGCPAKLDWTFIAWVWNFNKKQRPQILEKMTAYPEKSIILRNPRDVEKLLSEL